MDMEGIGMYEGYTHMANIFLTGGSEELQQNIWKILEQEAEKVSKDLIHVLVCNEIYKRRHGGRRGMIAFL